MLFDRIWDKLAQAHSQNMFQKKVQCDGQPSIQADVTVLATDMEVGKRFCAYRGSCFWGEGPIRIGSDVTIGKDAILYSGAGGGIVIGDGVSIAAQSYIIDSDHGIEADKPIRTQPMVSSPIVIEGDVWIGAGVKVLKGVTLGHGCVCAAGAVVTKDVPSKAIVGGVPAQIIGWR